MHDIAARIHPHHHTNHNQPAANALQNEDDNDDNEQAVVTCLPGIGMLRVRGGLFRIDLPATSVCKQVWDAFLLLSSSTNTNTTTTDLLFVLAPAFAYLNLSTDGGRTYYMCVLHPTARIGLSLLVALRRLQRALRRFARARQAERRLAATLALLPVLPADVLPLLLRRFL